MKTTSTYFQRSLPLFGGLLLTCCLAALSACGGASGSGSAEGFSVGGTVSNLSGGQLSLVNNGNTAFPAVVTGNGAFTFFALVQSGGNYNVTVNAQPAGQVCTVQNGQGSHINAAISNVQVICSSAASAVTVGGTVSGLASGSSLQLINNHDAANAVTVSGGSGAMAFTFTQPIAMGSGYGVTLAAQPSGQFCSVTNAYGMGSASNISNINVQCVAGSGTITGPGSSGGSTNPGVPGGPGTGGSGGNGNGSTTFNIGGVVSGLAGTLALVDNADPASTLSITANGGFSFGIPVVTGSSYLVTIASQPAGQLCSVGGATGVVGAANISNVNVKCVASAGTTMGAGSSGGSVPGAGGAGGNGNGSTTFNVGGTVLGLASGSVTLVNSGDTSHALTVSGNGAFTFGLPVVTGSNYGVSITAQPAGQLCSVANATGVVGTANAGNVAVSCVSTSSSFGPGPLTVGGTVTGLAGTLTLLNNGDAANPAVITANGAYTFPAQMSPGSSYSVTVSGQPSGQICTVSSRLSVTANNVICSATSYTIGGTVSGLTSGTVGLVVNGDAANAVTSGNGSFSFAVPVAAGSSYQVSLAAQPGAGQSCGVSNAVGSNVSANVTNVAVSCASSTAVLTSSPAIYNFGATASDAANPGGLTLGPDGDLYGVAGGGANGVGSIFRVTPSGAESVVYSLTTADGLGGVTFGQDGNLYGVAYTGGAASGGYVFQLTTAGVATTKYSFATKSPDVNLPSGPLVLGVDGTMYGMTQCDNVSCVGGIFKFNPVSGAEVPLLLFDRALFADAFGQSTFSGITTGYDGNIYGASYYGGAASAGCIYRVTPAGVATCLYSFNGGADGSTAGASAVSTPVQHTDGNLYGAVNNSIYQVTTAGAYTLLYTFANATPNYLVSGGDGNLYGVAAAAAGGVATVFQLTPTGTVTTLYTFASLAAAPQFLVFGNDGYLYGTTYSDGTNGKGTVIKMLR